MKGRTRFYGLVVLVLLIWPAFQWHLVQHRDVNPWKLFGFAMYCTYHNVRVILTNTTEGRADPIRPTSGEPRAQYREFLRNRSSLGQLASPDRLAQSLFEYDQEIRSLSIAVVVTRLDPSTQRLVAKRTVYDF